MENERSENNEVSRVKERGKEEERTKKRKNNGSEEYNRRIENLGWKGESSKVRGRS